MITQDDFIRIIRDEFALPLAGGDLESDLDQVVSWDSMHVLRLVSALEKETGRRIPIGRLLEELSLRGMYERVATAV
ncbi:phosphopantetheine-binding protein [Frankia sp. EAN1pec]|uniref:phosphopantetheine-binding protein n=1 Tax=Parafrankia sp. (strain EAN1pec) TaxID=298653 RepID=UPI0000543669